MDDSAECGDFCDCRAAEREGVGGLGEAGGLGGGVASAEMFQHVFIARPSGCPSRLMSGLCSALQRTCRVVIIACASMSSAARPGPWVRRQGADSVGVRYWSG